MVVPHLKVPASGSSSSIKILNSVVVAISSSPTKAILSPLFTRKLTLSSTFRPSTVLVRPSTARISLPGSRSILKPTKG